MAGPGDAGREHERGDKREPARRSRAIKRKRDRGCKRKRQADGRHRTELRALKDQLEDVEFQYLGKGQVAHLRRRQREPDEAARECDGERAARDPARLPVDQRVCGRRHRDGGTSDGRAKQQGARKQRGRPEMYRAGGDQRRGRCAARPIHAVSPSTLASYCPCRDGTRSRRCDMPCTVQLAIAVGVAGRLVILPCVERPTFVGPHLLAVVAHDNGPVS